MFRLLPLLLLAIGAIAEESPPPFQEPQGVLTLEQAVAAALANSPVLATFPWDLRIGDARILQARLRENPELSVSVDNIQLGAGADDKSTTRTLGLGPDGLVGSYERETETSQRSFSDGELTISLSQVIELGGKRAARIAAAKKDREVISWDYEVARFDVAGEVLLRFVELLAAQERLRNEQSLVELADELADKVGQLADAGSVSPLEVRRARAESALANVKRQDRVRAIEQARLKLAATWGSTQPNFTVAEGNIATTKPLPSLQTLLEKRAQHPALQRWGAELARREAMLTVERKNRIPNVTVGLGYRGTSAGSPGSRSYNLGTDGATASRTSTNGENWEHGVVLEASIPLPLFHRNQGAIQEAELMVGRLSDEQRAWEKNLEAALTENYAEASASLERLEALTSNVQPELESTFTLTKEGYERGKFDFLRVLDARRALVDARLEALDARINYHLAIAELEGLVGTEIFMPTKAITEPSTELHEKEQRHE